MAGRRRTSGPSTDRRLDSRNRSRLALAAAALAPRHVDQQRDRGDSHADRRRLRGARLGQTERERQPSPELRDRDGRRAGRRRRRAGRVGDSARAQLLVRASAGRRRIRWDRGTDRRARPCCGSAPSLGAGGGRRGRAGGRRRAGGTGRRRERAAGAPGQGRGKPDRGSGLDERPRRPSRHGAPGAGVRRATGGRRRTTA